MSSLELMASVNGLKSNTFFLKKGSERSETQLHQSHSQFGSSHFASAQPRINTHQEKTHTPVPSPPISPLQQQKIQVEQHDSPHQETPPQFRNLAPTMSSDHTNDSHATKQRKANWRATKLAEQIWRDNGFHTTMNETIINSWINPTRRLLDEEYQAGVNI